jgi:hypothetical protein
MERVTIEHNGERITVEVPEGMSDEEIMNFVKNQSTDNRPPPKKEKLSEELAKGFGDMALAGAKATGEFVMDNPAASIGAAALYGVNKLTGNPLGKAGSAIAGYGLGKGKEAIVGGAERAKQFAGDVKMGSKYYGDIAKAGVSELSGSKVKYPTLGKIGAVLGDRSAAPLYGSEIKTGIQEGTKQAASKASALATKSPLSRLLGIPLSLLTQTDELNADEEEELEKRRKMAPTITPKKP